MKKTALFIILIFVLVIQSCSKSKEDKLEESEIDLLIEPLEVLDGTFETWLERMDEASKKSHEIGYNKGIVESNLRLASKLVGSGGEILKEKLDIIDSVLQIDPSCFSDTVLFRFYCMKGYNYQQFYDPSNQLVYYFKADSIAKASDNTEFKVNSYNNFLNYYNGINRLDKTLEYSRLILEETKNATDKRGRFNYLVTVYNMGSVYGGLEQYDSGAYLINKAINEGLGEFVVLGAVYLELGEVYFEKENMDSAKKYVHLSQDHLDINRDIESFSGTYNLLGKINQKENKMDSAIQHFYKGLHYADTIGSLAGKIESNRLLVNAFLTKSGEKEQLVRFEEYVELADSVFTEITDLNDKEMLARFDTEKKELEIQNLKSENRRKKTEMYSTIIIAILLIVLLVFGSLFKRKMLKQDLENKRLENELVNTELNNAIQKVKDHRQTINSLKSDIENSKANIESLDEISELLDQNYINETNWLKIITHFDQLNDNFIKRIKEKYSVLTKNDLRLMVLVRLNYSNKAIAEVKNVSESSVKKSKQRLLAKLNLSKLRDVKL